jgi:hypothetical protein
MTVEELKEVHHAQPFRPFTIHTTDGRAVHVPHSDFMSFSQTGRTAHVHGENDSYVVLDTRLVTQIEVHEASAK